MNRFLKMFETLDDKSKLQLLDEMEMNHGDMIIGSPTERGTLGGWCIRKRAEVNKRTDVRTAPPAPAERSFPISG